ncbi:nuclear transport factor 2 family protein [Rohdeia mirabilis]
MTRDQLIALAGWYKDSGNLSADPRKKIEVVDVLENVATAKLVADWGVDFMQLTKTNGEWQIVHIVWNSHPE